jgi:NAD(P)H-dependent FMN reductase
MTIVGLGGSLRRGSTNLSALERALAGATGAAADTVLLDLRQLGLPMFDPEHEEPVGAAEELVETCYSATGLLWSSPLYQGRSQAPSRTHSTGCTSSAGATRRTCTTR